MKFLPLRQPTRDLSPRPSGYPDKAGDVDVMPTDLDVYAPERWVDDALFRPEVRDAYQRLVAQGWTDAYRLRRDLVFFHSLRARADGI
jgi:hypothetical protein